MKRSPIAPGAFLTEVPGEKFKRSRVIVHLVAPGARQNATELALLPHVLDRRCAAIPDALELSRTLYSLYGADLSSESYTAGPSRVLAMGAGGLKNSFALAGEDLAARYSELVCEMLFRPVLEKGAFSAEDVGIEKTKQAEYLKSEMNDKRNYCLRQARRKLYGASPLGIESPGYLEDVEAITPQSLHAAWQNLLSSAQIEVLVCGLPAGPVAERLAKELAAIPRGALPVPEVPALPSPTAFSHFDEAMPTTQGKLCIMATSGQRDSAQGEAVMRLASALFGGLPTSRLFMNVREKQSLCYYCASSYAYYGGVLTVDSGIDHKNAEKAAAAILAELETMQRAPVSAQELENAKLYMRGVFSAAKDSPDALMSFSFGEWLRGANRSLDDISAACEAVTADEIQAAMARFAPAVQYLITNKEGA